MSVNVTIPIKANATINFEYILPPNYYYGTRNPYDVLEVGVESPNMVFFDCKAFGRGVDIEFLEKSISVTLHTPSSTSDFKLFKKLTQWFVKVGSTKEVICEDENISVDHLDEVFTLAEENLRAGFDFIATTKISDDDPIEIIGALFPIAIDSVEQRQFRKSQAAFDKYLHEKHRLPGTRFFVTPFIAEVADGSAIWFASIKCGCYMIIPSKAEPRKRNIKVDKYILLWQEHSLDFREFLKHIDTSRRFDARRCIVKLNRKELEDIIKKSVDPLEAYMKKASSKSKLSR